MKAYSDDLRTRIILDSNAGMRTKALAIKHHVSPAWVRNLKRLRRETGSISPRPRTSGRYRRFPLDRLPELEGLLKKGAIANGLQAKYPMLKTLYLANREGWRAWLANHHAAETEVWLIYYKKQTARPRIPYEHAVEEALCFGWIDSNVRRIDDERFAQKFTPRRNRTKWSSLNKQRMRKLIRDEGASHINSRRKRRRAERLRLSAFLIAT